jgi:hypothetical protein
MPGVGIASLALWSTSSASPQALAIAPWGRNRWFGGNSGGKMPGPGRDAMRLKPSDVGWFKKGIPDAETMGRLQSEFARKKLESGALSEEVLLLWKRMTELKRKGDPNSLSEGLEIAKRLLPHLHFIVDDVDWDRS